MENEIRLPAAFSDRMRDELKDGYDSFISSYQEQEIHSLRINTLKSGEDIREEFRLLRVPWAENGYYYDGNLRPGRHPLHEAGAYYIQEASAMFPAGLLNVKPGMRVLDLCAAPGGKSGQIAEALKGRGLLVSNEIISSRADILSENIERLGVRNAVVTNEEPGRLAEAFPEFFQRILVDAPCSGEGMFRKNPAAIEEWSEDNVQMCADRQRDILNSADKLLSPGGIMVYSTCTFSVKENEDNIRAFLSEHPDYEMLPVSDPGSGIIQGDIEGTYRLYPHLIKGEGHFAAVLRKTGEEPEAVSGSVRPGRVDKETLKAYEEFADKTFIRRHEFDRLMLFGEDLCAVPRQMVNIDGIRGRRCGLKLGRQKKGRFIPDHAWAMTLSPAECRSYPLEDIEEAKAFIRGEALPADTEKGWLAVTFMNYSLGWGKVDGRLIKNHYPKGLRKSL